MIEKILLFKNTNKKEDKHPDWRINLEIDGKLVEIGGAWSNTGQKGEYISGKISKNVTLDVKVEAYKKPEQTGTGMNDGFSNPDRATEQDDILSNIPF